MIKLSELTQELKKGDKARIKEVMRPQKEDNGLDFSSETMEALRKGVYEMMWNAYNGIDNDTT